MEETVLSQEEILQLYKAFLLDTLAQALDTQVDQIFFSLTDAEAIGVNSLSSISFFNNHSDLLGEKVADTFHKQPRESFGQRMKDGVTWIFDQGYTKVIVLGADSPHIQPRVINETISLLDDFDVVLGPSSAGGIYLIGLLSTINLKGFERGFDHVELVSFMKYATHRKLQVHLLEELSDIDQEEDLVTFIAWLSSAVLLTATIELEDMTISLPHHSMGTLDRLGLFIDIDPKDNRKKSINKLTIKSVED